MTLVEKYVADIDVPADKAEVDTGSIAVTRHAAGEELTRLMINVRRRYLSTRDKSFSIFNNVGRLEFVDESLDNRPCYYRYKKGLTDYNSGLKIVWSMNTSIEPDGVSANVKLIKHGSLRKMRISISKQGHEPDELSLSRTRETWWGSSDNERRVVFFDKTRGFIKRVQECFLI